MTLWLWIACGEPPATPVPPPPQDLADCARYRDADQEAFCVTGLVARGLAPLSACRPHPDHGPACRSGWVTGALSRGEGSREALLEACDSAADCALAVLDARPLADTPAQLAACRAHTGPYAADCTIHALQRWAAAGPDAASFAAVASEQHHGEAVGALLGWVVGCAGVGTCDQASGQARAACERAVSEDIPARPEICRSGLGQR